LSGTRFWPADRCFQIFPIVSTSPLVDLRISAAGPNGKKIRTGLIPAGARRFYPRSLIWAGGFEAPDELKNIRKGAVVLSLPEPPAEPFPYQVAAVPQENAVGESIQTAYSPGIQVLCNPFRDRLEVRIQGGSGSQPLMEMFDVLGRHIDIPFSEVDRGKGKTVVFDTRGLAVGVYILKPLLQGLKPVRVVRM
ncbi:hypothetical protein JW906_03300, partial [bacterium]|nr:hypothetical protein [bacterium]